MNIRQMADHKFIFICGLHRSGTSVLFKTFRDHPKISGFQGTGSPENEGMHLQTVCKPSGHYGGAGKFGFNPHAHLTEASSLVSDSNRQKLFSEWSIYWDLNKPFLLEKSPPNLIRTRFLQAMFPKSYFVVIMRHPVAVSYATRAWYKTYRIYRRRLPRILEHWLICHELFMQDKAFLNNAFILKYEQFVSQPTATLEKIFDFLGLEHHPPGQEIRPSVNEKYFSMWADDLKNRFSRFTVGPMVKQYEERVNRFGYSLEDLHLAGPVC